MSEQVTTAIYKKLKGKTCWQSDNLGVSLIQTGVDRFTVVYGMQVKDRLTYGQAATEFGACIMHALACDGKLDNRKRGEH